MRTHGLSYPKRVVKVDNVLVPNIRGKFIMSNTEAKNTVNWLRKIFPNNTYSIYQAKSVMDRKKKVLGRTI
jgi:hypothetical protein